MVYKPDEDVDENNPPRGKITAYPDFSDLTAEQQPMALDNYKCKSGHQQDSYNWINKNLDKDMFFLGRTATGKTHLATGVYKKQVIKGKHCLYITNYEMLMNCGAEYFNIDIRNFYTDFDLLAIEETEKFPQTQKQSELDTFFYIINKRYANHKQTILISNYTWDELIEKIGKENAEPLNRRFADRGMVIECNWEAWEK